MKVTAMPETLLVLAMYLLVAARLTRMVNYDNVLDWLRLLVARRATAAHNAALGSDEALNIDVWTGRYARWVTVENFIVCPWCVGLWIAAALAPAPILILGWSWWTWAALPFAASHLIGMGDRLVSEDVQIEEG